MSELKTLYEISSKDRCKQNTTTSRSMYFEIRIILMKVNSDKAVQRYPLHPLFIAKDRCILGDCLDFLLIV